ncbi:MAG TPA: glycosyltransferase family 2 protein [Candidatus Saccharimonadales bacterium]|nr:glycosyltransferase family 2 protein [Candidatus Saccharimonadales bacterium]
MTQKMISVIVPIYNEVANIPELYKKIRGRAAAWTYNFEFIFVDDGSTDNSLIALERLARGDERVRIVEFARNFGKEAAVSAGLHAARGDAAIMIDADLQHPPELIDNFIIRWEKGADVVVGVRRYAKSESWFKRASSDLFYRIMQRIAQTNVTPHATDFRLVDRKVIDAFSRLTERNRMARGLIDWLGFKQDFVYFEAGKRLRGERAYTFRKLMILAINSFTSYSLLPLKLAGYLGSLILALSIPAGAALYIEDYLLKDPLHWGAHGTAMLAVLLVMLVGLVLACLGLMSLYIANIHAEVTNRPLYVVRNYSGGLYEGAQFLNLGEREGAGIV